FLPRWSGPPLLVAAIVVEAVAPFCIVFGWHDRIAAFVLALFCVVTAILYHPFWKFSDFWKSGNSVARSHFWDFLKNFGLVGGLLLIVFATQLAPAGVVARRVSHQERRTLRDFERQSMGGAAPQWNDVLEQTPARAMFSVLPAGW